MNLRRIFPILAIPFFLVSCNQKNDETEIYVPNNEKTVKVLYTEGLSYQPLKLAYYMTEGKFLPNVVGHYANDTHSLTFTMEATASYEDMFIEIPKEELKDEYITYDEFLTLNVDNLIYNYFVNKEEKSYITESMITEAPLTTLGLSCSSNGFNSFYGMDFPLIKQMMNQTELSVIMSMYAGLDLTNHKTVTSMYKTSGTNDGGFYTSSNLKDETNVFETSEEFSTSNDIVKEKIYFCKTKYLKVGIEANDSYALFTSEGKMSGTKAQINKLLTVI